MVFLVLVISIPSLKNNEVGTMTVGRYLQLLDCGSIDGS